MAYDAEAAAKLVWTEVFNRPTGKNPRGIIAKYLRAAYAMQHDTDRLAFAAAAERTLPKLLGYLENLVAFVEGECGSLGEDDHNVTDCHPVIDEARALLATLGREAR